MKELIIFGMFSFQIIFFCLPIDIFPILLSLVLDFFSAAHHAFGKRWTFPTFIYQKCRFFILYFLLSLNFGHFFAFPIKLAFAISNLIVLDFQELAEHASLSHAP